MSQNNFIKTLMNIQEENLQFSNDCTFIKKKDITSKRLHATLNSENFHLCPFCNSAHIVRNGWKTSYIRFLKFQQYPIEIALKKQRFLCKECKHTFMQDTTFVKRNSSISKSIKISILLKLKDKISLKDIAKEHNVSITTVQRIMNEGYRDLTIPKKTLPKVLCFDEFKSTKDSAGAMSFIFMDGINRKIIDIVENRQLYSLENYFSKFSYSARKNVEHIVIDMYSPYMTLIKNYFPNAKIVIDRFHIVQLINRALNKTRIDTMNSFKTNEPTIYRKYKKEWKLFLYDSLKLGHKRVYCRSFRYFISQNEKVDYLLKRSEILEKDYDIYQGLLYSIEKNDFTSFFNQINRDFNKVSKHMKIALKTLKKYKEFIINTLETTYNNGVIEGTNNLIKCIKRISFGYRCFSNFRKRIMIIKGLIDINNEII